ncbi:MAG: aldo/keto reductase [Asgard group archaeon]|nr:aldo/keto reductase [Asgard group archaeon]
MDKITLGKSDLKISRIGLGTLAFGHRSKGIQDKNEIFNCINYAIDNGINFIDTAEEYSGGLTEKYIGEVLKDRNERENIIISTKVSPVHLGYKEVIKAANHSLERLQTDYIDLYLVHWPWPYSPIPETMRAMDELLADGKIRYAGVSNFKNHEVELANNSLKNGEIIVNQIEYNLVNRIIEKEMIPYLKKNGIDIMAYSPLLSGFLTAKYDENTTFSENDFRNYDPHFKNKENLVQAKPLFDLMKVIAKNHNATPAEVAINWLLKDDFVIPIPGAKKTNHVDSNIHATQWKLTKDEIVQLTAVSDKLDFDLF